MNESLTGPHPAETGTLLSPTGQEDVAEMAKPESPDGQVEDMDLAHDMALAGNKRRSRAAYSRAEASLIEDAVSGREEIEAERPTNYDSPSHDEDLKMYRERINEFFKGIGERDDHNRRDHLGSTATILDPDSSDEDRTAVLVENGERIANPRHKTKITVYEKRKVASKNDKIAEREEQIVELLHDHPELVTRDGKPMTPEDYKSATENWERMDIIEREALFVELGGNDISKQIENMCRSVEFWAVPDDLDKDREAARGVLKLASHDGTTVREIRDAAAGVVRGLKAPFEKPYGPRISLINNEVQ